MEWHMSLADIMYNEHGIRIVTIVQFGTMSAAVARLMPSCHPAQYDDSRRSFIAIRGPTASNPTMSRRRGRTANAADTQRFSISLRDLEEPAQVAHIDRLHENGRMVVRENASYYTSPHSSDKRVHREASEFNAEDLPTFYDNKDLAQALDTQSQPQTDSLVEDDDRQHGKQGARVFATMVSHPVYVTARMSSHC